MKNLFLTSSLSLMLCTSLSALNQQKNNDGSVTFSLLQADGSTKLQRALTMKRDSQGFYRWRNFQGQWGLLNEQGLSMTQEMYNHIDSWKMGHARVKNASGAVGLIDMQGVTVVKAQHLNAVALRRDRFALQDSSGWKITDASGSPVSTNTFRHARLYNQNLIAVKTTENKWGLLSIESGEFTFPAEAAMIGELKNGMATVKLGNTYGFLNSEGQLAIPAKYNFAGGFDNSGSALVKQANGQWLKVNKNGQAAEQVFKAEYASPSAPAQQRQPQVQQAPIVQPQVQQAPVVQQAPIVQQAPVREKTTYIYTSDPYRYSSPYHYRSRNYDCNRRYYYNSHRNYLNWNIGYRYNRNGCNGRNSFFISPSFRIRF